MGETTPEDAASARAAEQARLRKERREAKIRAGGSARLNKITGLGGGMPRDDPTPVSSAAATPERKPGTARPTATGGDKDLHGDPDEVDISEHFYEPRLAARRVPSGAAAMPLDPGAVSEDQLRQMMLGFEPPRAGAGPGGAPFDPFGFGGDMGGAGAGAGFPGMEGMQGMEGMENDPMMKMLQQMMGGAGAGAGGFPGFPGMPGQQGPSQGMPQPAGVDWYSVVFRLLHFLVALGLGCYLALSTASPFAGTRGARDLDASLASSGGLDASAARRRFVYAFGTAETALLTTRFFLDRGRNAPLPGGWVGAAVGFLPPGHSLRTRAEMVLRYGRMLLAVRADILVVVFVLGVFTWFRGVAA